MKLFPIFKSGRLYKPSWRYRLKGQMWRLLFSDGNLIAGEDRDASAKNTTYFCLDRLDGSVQWEGKKFGDPWWTTSEGIYGGNLYLHAFAKPDLPNPRHVTAIDVHTGELLWEHPDYTFVYALDDDVIVEKSLFERSEYLRVDRRSGEIREKLADAGSVETGRIEARERDPHTLLQFPDIYGADNPEQRAFTPFVSILSGKERLIGPVDVLSYGGNAMLAFHRQSGGKSNGNTLLTHELHIYRSDDHTLLYSDILYENAPAPVPDAFIVRDDMLYYIRNKNEIVAITLQEQP